MAGIHRLEEQVSGDRRNKRNECSAIEVRRAIRGSQTILTIDSCAPPLGTTIDDVCTYRRGRSGPLRRIEISSG